MKIYYQEECLTNAFKNEMRGVGQCLLQGVTWESVVPVILRQNDEYRGRIKATSLVYWGKILWLSSHKSSTLTLSLQDTDIYTEAELKDPRQWTELEFELMLHSAIVHLNQFYH